MNIRRYRKELSIMKAKQVSTWNQRWVITRKIWRDQMIKGGKLWVDKKL